MEKNTPKEEWINAVINSTDGMHRAIANPFLYQKVLHKLEQQNQPVNLLPGFVLRRWAIAATLVMALNILTIAHFAATGTKNEQNQSVIELRNEMGLGNTYNY